MENRNKNIDESEKAEAKNLLEELKLNSMNIFKKLIKELQDEENKDKKIS
jgi:histone deacetylase complex regulatory component SIN3